MPLMNGIEAAIELRQKYGNKLKIFLLTGDIEIQQDGFQKDLFDGILFKPCGKDEIAKCLDFR